MKKILLLLMAVASLTIANAHAATLQADSIFATSEENLQTAARLSGQHPPDEAGLEEMDREGKINLFHTPMTVTIVHRGFMTVSFRFPGKTKVLWAATEEVID
jgi:hypothetical protein